MATAAPADIEAPQANRPSAEILSVVAEAAEHASQAMPELLVLMKGGSRFNERARPYLNEVIHCLASALEAALVASHDVERAGIGAPRRGGEDAVAIVVRDFLDRSAG